MCIFGHKYTKWIDIKLNMVGGLSHYTIDAQEKTCQRCNKRKRRKVSAG